METQGMVDTQKPKIVAAGMEEAGDKVGDVVLYEG
jgi:hypothetical protein